MSLKHGLLGLLNYGQMTGYELAKSFNESLYFFWPAQASQIYRELNQMEKLGWLDSQVVFQTDKPNKKLYAITESGRAELKHWLQNKDADTGNNMRNSFLLHLFFAGELSTQENTKMLKAYQAECEQAQKTLAGTKANIEHYAKLVNSPKATLYWQLCAKFGQDYLKMCQQFAKEACQILEEQA